MKLSRRGFLTGLGTLSIVGIAATTFSYFYWGKRPDRLIVEILRKRLGSHLILDKTSLDKFLEYYLMKEGGHLELKMRLFSMLTPLYRYTNTLEYTPLRDYIWWRERDVIHQFLMATDYFNYPSYPIDRPLTFNHAYEPRKQPCRNPFADLS